MVNLDWHNIHSINGSQQDGFEEFICQLAGKQKYENKKQFIRKGRPDGGVECFLIFNDDSEIAWQAKFFTDTFSTSQWNQINSSVKTALSTHNNLKKYIVCFPYDFPDARNKRKGKQTKSAFEKWNDYVGKWTFECEKRGMNVEFSYWGSSELIQILQDSDYASFLNFWFNKSFLSDKFIDDFNARMIKNLGPRYFKDIDVKIPFYAVQHWIDRDEVFYETLNNLYKDISSLLDDLTKFNNHTYSSFVVSLNTLWHDFCEEYEHFDTEEELKSIKIISVKLLEIAEELRKKWFEDKNDNSKFFEKNEDLLSKLYLMEKFLNENPGSLYEKPYLLVHGSWGMGKSHALASILEQRKEKKLKSLLFLGQTFTTDESPEQQILNILDIQNSFSDILEGLNCLGVQSNQRVLIIIDAINEGNGKKIWTSHLANFVNKVSQYEHLGIILSVRSTYLEVFKEQINILKNTLSQTSIDGFSIQQDEAIRIFFDYYKINAISTPILNPEFSNPLFLTLFCKTYQNRNLGEDNFNRISLSKIFSDYTNYINKVLSIKNGYDNLGNAVVFFINEFAKMTLEKKREYLNHTEIRTLHRKVRDEFSITGNFIDDLLSENVIVKDIYGYNNREEVFLLSYERFLDYVQAHCILDEFTGNDLRDFLSNESNSYIYDVDYRGLLESLIICFADDFNSELLEYFPISVKNNILRSYLDSLKWRIIYPNNTLLLNWIKDQLKSLDNRIIFFEKIFELLTKKNCPFNANYLFDILFPLSMADRDYIWSIAVCSPSEYYYEETSSISSFINNIISNNQTFSDEIVFSYSISLSWLLSVSNRKLRDLTTKCLIKLLTNHTSILLALLQKFEGINDPYIYERLFAVCYGVLTRSETFEKGTELGEYIYKSVFDKKDVYANILLRDYAKQSIQILLMKSIPLNIDIKKCLPPYHSEFLRDFPSNDEIDNNYNTFTGEKLIRSSMITEYGRGTGYYGDFGRYIFGYCVSNWKEIDENLLSNLAVKWIFEKYGWTAERFDDFDKQIGSGRARDNKLQERIGKKYQWIALYEILARLADNVSYYPNIFHGKPRLYQGSFENSIRNIDPTLGLKVVNEVRVNLYDISFNQQSNFQDWLHDGSDLPQIKELILEKSGKYICLFKHFKKIDNETGNFNSDSKDKEIWMWIQSFLVKKADIQSLFGELKNQNFNGRWLPEPSEFHNVYSREFYDSDAYNYYMNEEGYCEEAEIRGIPNVSVIPTSIEYRYESSSDYSLDETLDILKPCQLFVQKMKLRLKENESYFYDSTGELVFFDDGESQKRQNALMGDKEKILNFIKKSDYTIMWSLLGEKQITNVFDFKAERYLPSYSQIAYLREDGKIVQSKIKTFSR